MTPIVHTIGLAVLAYLLGSIPCGLVLTRLFLQIDIRRHGSGNIGATNVARTAGAGLGLATLAGDALKAWAPVHLALLLFPAGLPGAETSATVSALLALMGHLFPVYTGFRGGGKGVAAAAGGFSALAPWAVLISAGVFLSILAATRRVSAGSLAAAAALPIAVYAADGSASVCSGAVVAAALIFMRHGANIRRLLAGTEPPFRLRGPSGR